MASEGFRRVSLPPRSEYRFELDTGETLAVRVVPDPLTGVIGDAEVFGAPLATGGQERWYTFGNEAKVAISSWGGAEIEIAGSASTEYMADEPSPLYTYGANLHMYLEKARIRAREQLRTDKKLTEALAALDVGSDTEQPPHYETDASTDGVYRPDGQGPRIMVVGPESAGKTTLIKFLANYAIRSPAVASAEDATGSARHVMRHMQEDSDASDDDDEEEGAKTNQDEDRAMGEITGWWPVIVSLDPAEGAVPVPGCLSAVPLAPIPMTSLPSPSPSLPYGTTTQTTGSLPPSITSVKSTVPLVQWLGHHNVRDNEVHTRRVIDWLAYNLEKRLAKDLRARASGLLIDMPSVATSDSRTRYAHIQYCARAFKADMILVVGHEKLNLELTRTFGASAAQGSFAPQIVKMPKSGGAVELDDLYRQRLQDLQVRTYFYGLGALAAGAPSAAELEGQGDTAALGAAAASALHILPGHAEPLGGLPTLNPYSTTIPLDLLEIYRVGHDRVAPSSALPIGAERAVSELQVVKLDPVNSSSDLSSLLHSILALVEPPRGGGGPGKPDSSAEPTDDELLGASVLGFLQVCVSVRLRGLATDGTGPISTLLGTRSQSCLHDRGSYPARRP